MTEFIVALLCFGQFECSYAPQAYYIQSPEAQALVVNTELEIRKVINPTFAEYVVGYGGQAALIASGKEATFNLNEYVIITTSKDKSLLGLKFRF